MKSRRAPDSQWLFTSPQRGMRDEHAKTFRESLLMVREAAELEWFSFHVTLLKRTNICSAGNAARETWLSCFGRAASPDLYEQLHTARITKSITTARQTK